MLWIWKSLRIALSMGFKDSYTVDLQVGDLLIMSPGQIHGVYSPRNAFLVGAHFIIAEILVSTLKAATRHREYDGVTNDESKEQENTLSI